MTKTLLLSVLLLVSGLALLPDTALAAPGDTTRVTIWNQRKLTRYGNYDTTATLPAHGSRYRKVLMHYILGRYACAPGSQYCGSWDYTTKVLVRPPAHDTLEMARIITPYATDWLTRNLTHDYVVDVTEYTPVLLDNGSFRFVYEGYTWGFTVTIRLEYIEGTPPQDPVDVTNVYDGTFLYGNAANPINSHLLPRTLTAPSIGTVRLKNIISGHGSDGSGCAEFCQRYYYWTVNGAARPYQTLWRADCGTNEVYPQTGTWLFNRGNWCPGAYVRPIWHPLTALTTPGQPFTLGITMPVYTTAPVAGSSPPQFIWTSQLVTSGPVNFTDDAGLEAIVSPNLDDNYLRENPSCGGPRIRLKNLGSNRLTAATIGYRVVGSAAQTYSWTGNLPFGRDTLVALPPLPTLVSNSTGGRFRAWVSQPNGQADPNAYNDTLTSRFAPSVILPRRTVVAMTTNNARNGGNNSQTGWEVRDVAGNVVASRTNALASTAYSDTLNLPGGCYALRVVDAGCDGFAWWYYTASGSGTTNGTMSLKNGNNGAVIRAISGDFGCEYTLNFRTPYAPAGTAPGTALAAQAQLYPNPSADGRFTLRLTLPAPQPLTLHVTDALGRSVWSQNQITASTAPLPLDLHQLPTGIYTLDVALQNGQHLFRQLAVQ